MLQGKNVLARVHPSLVSSEIVESWLLGGNWQDQIVEKIVSGAGGGSASTFSYFRLCLERCSGKLQKMNLNAS